MSHQFLEVPPEVAEKELVEPSASINTQKELLPREEHKKLPAGEAAKLIPSAREKVKNTIEKPKQ